MECELCNFENPKGTATGVFLKDNKILTLKRSEEPFKGKLDLPGGYMNKGETPEATLVREMKEELGVDIELTYIGPFPGTASWKEKSFPILSHVYLADIGEQEIKLDTSENEKIVWISLKDLNPGTIAFNSNQDIAKYVKDKFTYNLERIRELVSQLDSTAEVKEQSLYKAIIHGHVSTKYVGSELVGMGWIFPRQTMLRKQAVVEDMIVDEKQRGKGLGRALLDDLVKWAAGEGVEMIELASNPKRIAANELYKRYGFQLHPTNHYLYKVS